MPRENVFKDRRSYAQYFILAVIEMLKFAVKEDYESSRSEIKLIPITLEFIMPELKKQGTKKGGGSKVLPKTLAKSNCKKKKQVELLKMKQTNQKYEDSSSSSDAEDSSGCGDMEDLGVKRAKGSSILNEELLEDSKGGFFLRFKENLPPLVKKDMMMDDLWVLMK